MNLNLNHLNVFVAAAEKMNITEAAKALFISQPAVSKTIKQLEDALQVRLFVRDKQKGIMLTDVGREILILARQMQSIENRIFQAASRENQLLTGKVKIGSFPAASTLLLPEAISRFRAKYPQVQIELSEGVSDQIKEWVTDRTVEIGLVASPFAGFEHHSLVQDHMVAVIPDDHELHNSEIVDLGKYEQDMIYCKGGHEAALNSAVQQHHFNLESSLTVQTAETLIQMVRRRLGIGLVFDFTLSSVSHELIVKPITPVITREIGIIALSFAEISPASTEFVRMMKES
ncbi:MULTISPECIES: LysR family transcriptional regulator [Paenibacillus]|uniref:LysR family transcriptional regulator n=1 Tax=Paenibacillus TaxID=44249 RepID=UPI000B7FB9B3|nr:MULTISPECIES: LysR family transcriptional regulator [unclassified Paenibacillus]OXL83599.1 LysR family transcriptional regulator [Paenibacillus sp. SSG-1]UYO02871.1 LysR family transcriptional regulator [Paenibacillus sp. PSB04]